MPKEKEKQRVVLVGSDVTVGQISDWWRMIGDGTIDHETLANILQNPKKFNKGVALVRVLKIFGVDKVITAEQVAKIYDLMTPQSVRIRYSEATLRRCAAENKSGASDWRLIYCHGLSLREQREKWGTDKEVQPCHHKDNTWWLKKEEDKWANFKPEDGYYLLNFKPRFANMKWQPQEDEIKKLGPQFERCHETIFSEAVFTNFKVNGERIAENWWHWGVSVSSIGGHVSVGSFDLDGWSVNSYYGNRCNPNLRVCLALKFEF